MTSDMRDAVQKLTARLGLAPVASREGVEEIVERMLFERGLDADVASIRWGTLELHCDAVTARFLRFDHDVLLSAVQAQAPEVRELRIRVVSKPSSS
jgi:hypothetical protein